MPDDGRLVALSDVRDLSVVRDQQGHIRALPQLEHVFDACLDALRAARPAAGTDARSDWNRVLLYVWPVVDLPLDEFDSVVSRLAPRTEGLGLEQILVQFRPAPELVGDGEPSRRSCCCGCRGRRGPGSACASPTRRAARCESSTPTRRR